MSKLKNPTLDIIRDYYYRGRSAEIVLLERSAFFEGASKNVMPFSTHCFFNIDSEWVHHFVEENVFGSDYFGLKKRQRVARSINSSEVRRKIGKPIAKISAGCLSRARHLPSSFPTHIAGGGIREHRCLLTPHDLKIACPTFLMLRHGEICEYGRV